MATKLTEQEIQNSLPNFPEWSYDQQAGALISPIEFPDFDAAVDFIVILRDLANSINHHPDIFLYDYKFVQVKLSTHEVEGVSDVDFQLAGMIDELFAQSVQTQEQPTTAATSSEQEESGGIVQSVLQTFLRRNQEENQEQPSEQPKAPVASAPAAPTQPSQPTQPAPKPANLVSPGAKAVIPPKAPATPQAPTTPPTAATQ